ncbi:hypothetical protein FRC08_002270 [Ceratobasidium sp. 394]|nr:hypothetical protein FRC08_002270 [Ceratobasidium sp. 394]KAG9094855.1 hypothetical protein FS749_011690 [Ceratobasidium sp. UAMH 11750]
MYRVFVTPELVAAICAGLYAQYLLEQDANTKEFQRTALVSTHFFHGMLPYIWESVKLLDLFKRKLIPAELTWRSGCVQAVCISQSISRETMSRFHFYAPYIKVLQVPIGTHATKIDNWKPLITYSKGNELLPNLVELKCGKFNLQALSAFLLPSTRKLTIDPPRDSGKQLDMASTRQLLEHVAHQCPDIHFLEFYPDPTAKTDTPPLSQTLALLSGFKNLRRLASTSVVIQPSVLQLVAQLPHLNTLSIGPIGSPDWDSSSCEQVPTGGFPALNNLTLCLANLQDAKQFWELVPLGMLKKLDLTILVANRGKSEFISRLCRASPQITELGLNFTNYRGGWAYEIDADTFEHMARLPITSCSFDGVKLEFEDAWAKVASSWPNLRSIKCGDQPTNLEDLIFLSSSLPKLETIECELDLDYAAEAIESNWSPVGQPSFYPQLRLLTFRKPNIGDIMLRGLEDRGRKSEIRDIARFLAYFWPKLTIEAVKEDSEEEEEGLGRDYYEMHREFLASRDASFSLFKDLVLSYVELYHKA